MNYLRFKCSVSSVCILGFHVTFDLDTPRLVMLVIRSQHWRDFSMERILGLFKANVMHQSYFI